MQGISNFINIVPFDDIFIIGDFNGDPFKVRFFNILESQMLDHSLSFCDVMQMLDFYFTYISQNRWAG